MADATGKIDGNVLAAADIKAMNSSAGRVLDAAVTKNPEESVAVAAGKVSIHGENGFVSVSATTPIDLTAADGTNPRRDLISVPLITGAQTPVLTDGTAGATPTLPDTPSESQALVEIKVNPQDTLYNDAMAAIGSWTNTGGNFTWNGTANTTTVETAYEDADRERSFNTYLYIKCDVKIATATAGQRMILHLNTSNDGTGDGYGLEFDGANISLSRMTGGGETALITSGSRSADTTYTVEAFRNPVGYWELYIDGTRIGSTQVKDTTFNFWRFVVMDNNLGTNQKDWDNLVVKELVLTADMRDFFANGNFTSDPVWTDTSGTWSAAANNLQSSTANAEIVTDLGATKDTSGGIYMKFTVSGAAGAADETTTYGFNSASDGTGDGYRVSVRTDDGTGANDALTIAKVGTDAKTLFTKASMGWDQATVKIIEAYREPEGRWRVIFNGTEQTTTATDGSEFENTAFFTNLRYVRIKNSSFAKLKTWDDLRVEGRTFKYGYEVLNLANRPQHGQVEIQTTTAADTTGNSTWTTMDALTFANEGYSKIQVNVTGPLDNGTGTGSVRVSVNGELIGVGDITTSGQDIPMSISGSIEGITGDYIEVLLEAKTSGGTITLGLPTKYTVVMV